VKEMLHAHFAQLMNSFTLIHIFKHFQFSKDACDDFTAERLMFDVELPELLARKP
jgi:hypothetical protein